MALRTGLKVILCVGEDIKTRRRCKKVATSFVKNQLEKNLAGTKNLKLKTENLIVAYEPIWAISTSRSVTSQDNSATPKDALEMIKFIKLIAKNLKLKTKVLYGGSVDGKDIESFLRYKEIDGALVGGASLKPNQFKGII